MIISKEQCLLKIGIKGITTNPRRVRIEEDRYKGFEVIEEKSESLKILEDFAPQLLYTIIKFTSSKEHVELSDVRELVLKCTQNKIDIFNFKGEKDA